MARTKQKARKTPKGGRVDEFGAKINPEKGAGRPKPVPELRHYSSVVEGEKERILQKKTARGSGEVEASRFFQKKSEGEPALASLVHAVNNSVGLPLLTAEDMIAARSELHEAAGAMGMELYLGTDASGEGDWPIEVAQHALYKKLTEGNITLDAARFGMNAKGKVPKVVMEIIHGSHAHSFDLVAELQFPTTSEVAADEGQECAGYHWRDLPVGKSGERGHFVAVRNGLVYDSNATGDAGHSLWKYTHLRHIKKLYKVVVAGAGGSAGEVQVTGGDETGDGDENNEEDEEQGGGEEEGGAEGEDV